MRARGRESRQTPTQPGPFLDLQLPSWGEGQPAMLGGGAAQDLSQGSCIIREQDGPFQADSHEDQIITHYLSIVIILSLCNCKVLLGVSS